MPLVQIVQGMLDDNSVISDNIVDRAITINKLSLDVGVFSLSGINALASLSATSLSAAQFTVSAGTSAVPAISPVGDTDTGLFFPTADTIAVATSGTEAMRINSAGRVGIGITNPTAKLYVLASQSSSFGTSIAPNSATSTVAIQNTLGDAVLFLGNDDRVSAGLGTLVNNGAAATFAGKLNNAGIGNIVFGAIGAYKENNTSANQQGYLSLYTRPSAGNLVERLRIDSSGQVGIGTTSPRQRLHQIGTFCIGGEGNNVNKLFFQVCTPYAIANKDWSVLGGFDNSAERIIYLGGGGWSRPDATSLRFFTASAYNQTDNAGVERLRIDSSGNVGIGLTPTARNNTRLQIVDGIGFPATQVASSDPNTLDDYEEGTWTPTLTNVTVGNGSFTVA